MKNINELSRDIAIVINRLQYRTEAENMLKAELLLNINKLLSSEEEYNANLAALREVKEIIEEPEKYYDNEVFNRVTCDVLGAISTLNYQDRYKLLDKVEILINLSKLFESQAAYYNNLRILNELNENRSHRM